MERRGFAVADGQEPGFATEDRGRGTARCVFFTGTQAAGATRRRVDGKVVRIDVQIPRPIPEGQSHIPPTTDCPYETDTFVLQSQNQTPPRVPHDQVRGIHGEERVLGGVCVGESEVA